jgi:cell migration-inducing and hyaluronan-binding protein
MVCLSCFLLFITSFMFIIPSPASPEGPDPCPNGFLSEHDKVNPPDLLIFKQCQVKAGGKYFYGNVNIIQHGELSFVDPPDATPTEFWARSILVENGGSLFAVAQNGAGVDKPSGVHGGILTIHLFGPDQSNGDPAKNPGMGALCRTPETATTGPCGIPTTAWLDNGKSELDLPGGVHDYFYRYGPLRGDEKCNDGKKWGPDKGDRCDERADPKTSAGVKVGYFGSKVLAVSYGGQIVLEGEVGRCENYPNGYRPGSDRCTPTWARLSSSIAKGDGMEGKKGFEIQARDTKDLRVPYISEHDEIVITTTDYLPGHSETFTVTKVERKSNPTDPVTVYVDHPAAFPHNGTRYSGSREQMAGSRL